MKRALVLSLICVFGLTFAGMGASLTGSWDTDVTIDVTQTNFSLALGLTSILTVNYIIGDWTFTSITELSDGGWEDQDFNAVGLLGAFDITTALNLGTLGTFGDLDLTIGWSMSGVILGIDVDLAGGDLFVFLTAEAVAGEGVTFEAELAFGTEDETNPVCDLNWAGLDLTVGFGFCCVDVELNLLFDCDGFTSAEFTFGGIAVPNLPWLTIDGSILFDLVAGKTFSVTPSFDFGAIVCFDLYWDTGINYGSWYEWGNGFVVDEFALSGIGLECTISGVKFEALTYWGEDIYGSKKNKSPGILAGFEDYYEAYKISTTDDACCGPFSFSFAVYFTDDGAAMDSLFDVDLFIATVSLEVASQFTFNMGLNVDALGGFTEWTVGFLVTW
jgi:hypothetical protein